MMMDPLVENYFWKDKLIQKLKGLRKNIGGEPKDHVVEIEMGKNFNWNWNE